MIEGIFNQPNYAAAKQLLHATLAEHRAIASNIANIETPNYKRIQLDPSFRSQLQQAVANKDIESVASLQPQVVEDTTAKASRLDGNTVVLENEMMELMRNQMDHAYAVQLLSGNHLRMRLAITGRPG